MKLRIRRKIVKQVCLLYSIEESFAWGYLAACLWVPGSARSLRRCLEGMLDEMMDYGYGRYSR